MNLLRIGIVIVFAIMLLPTGETAPDGRLRRTADQGNFCDRYPKTCDASAELLEAFKQKLTYGVMLARQELQGHSDPISVPPGASGELAPFEVGKLNGRLEPARPPLPVSAPFPSKRSTALRAEERSTEWLAANRR